MGNGEAHRADRRGTKQAPHKRAQQGGSDASRGSLEHHLGGLGGGASLAESERLARAMTDQSLPWEVGGSGVPYKGSMEARFDTSFDDVAVLKGQAGNDLCAHAGANAITHGSAIAFRDDHPTSATVAHELAHVVQQRQGRAGTTSTASPGALESQARSVATGAMTTEGLSAAPPLVQLEEAPGGKGTSTTQGEEAAQEVSEEEHYDPDTPAQSSMPSEKELGAALEELKKGTMTFAKLLDDFSSTTLPTELTLGMFIELYETMGLTKFQQAYYCVSTVYVLDHLYSGTQKVTIDLQSMLGGGDVASSSYKKLEEVFGSVLREDGLALEGSIEELADALSNDEEAEYCSKSVKGWMLNLAEAHTASLEPNGLMRITNLIRATPKVVGFEVDPREMKIGTAKGYCLPRMVGDDIVPMSVGHMADIRTGIEKMSNISAKISKMMLPSNWASSVYSVATDFVVPITTQSVDDMLGFCSQLYGLKGFPGISTVLGFANDMLSIAGELIGQEGAGWSEGMHGEFGEAFELASKVYEQSKALQQSASKEDVAALVILHHVIGTETSS